MLLLCTFSLFMAMDGKRRDKKDRSPSLSSCIKVLHLSCYIAVLLATVD